MSTPLLSQRLATLYGQSEAFIVPGRLAVGAESPASPERCSTCCAATLATWSATPRTVDRDAAPSPLLAQRAVSLYGQAPMSAAITPDRLFAHGDEALAFAPRCSACSTATCATLVAIANRELLRTP